MYGSNNNNGYNTVVNQFWGGVSSYASAQSGGSSSYGGVPSYNSDGGWDCHGACQRRCHECAHQQR